jgi:predicted CoA-binding protein
MPTIKEAASEFLANSRVAITGVSREAKGHGSNVVYQRLRARGYEVFAVNPNAEEVEGDPCYRDLRSIPGGVEAVVDRNEAGDRRRNDARVRRARDQACVDAPRPRRRQRL